jgi:hypothetical protein
MLMERANALSKDNPITSLIKSGIWATQEKNVKSNLEAALSGMARVKGESGGRLSDQDIARTRGAITDFFQDPVNNAQRLTDFRVAMGRLIALTYEGVPIEQIKQIHPDTVGYLDYYLEERAGKAIQQEQTTLQTSEKIKQFEAIANDPSTPLGAAIKNGQVTLEAARKHYGVPSN